MIWIKLLNIVINHWFIYFCQARLTLVTLSVALLARLAAADLGELNPLKNQNQISIEWQCLIELSGPFHWSWLYKYDTVFIYMKIRKYTMKKSRIVKLYNEQWRNKSTFEFRMSRRGQTSNVMYFLLNSSRQAAKTWNVCIIGLRRTIQWSKQSKWSIWIISWEKELNFGAKQPTNSQCSEVWKQQLRTKRWSLELLN